MFQRFSTLISNGCKSFTKIARRDNIIKKEPIVAVLNKPIKTEDIIVAVKDIDKKNDPDKALLFSTAIILGINSILIATQI